MRLSTSRRGIGEVVGSVSMLAVTIALLAGASAVAVFSIRDASSLIQDSNRAAQRDVGVLVSVLAVQRNGTGTFMWFYDYGWASEPIKAVYVAGQAVPWTSSCGGSWSGSLCLVFTPSTQRGELTVVIGGFSIAASG